MDNELFCAARNITIEYNNHGSDSPKHYLIFLLTFSLHLCISLIMQFLDSVLRIRKKPLQPVILESSEPIQTQTKKITTRRNKSLSCPAVFSTFGRFKSPHECTEDDLRIANSDANDSQENLYEYCWGGYKPTAIGENLGDYTVIRKLGFGHFSTVWLCEEQKTAKYVAVKVVKAVHMFDNMAREEIRLNEFVNVTKSDSPGRKLVIQMLGHFNVDSVNGNHVCMAFELMGPSLLHLITQSHYQGIYDCAVKSIIKQILLGLVYLHTECNIIHTDLKPENILIKVSDAYIKNMVDKASRYNELGIPMPRSYVTSETFENPPYDHLPLLPEPDAFCHEPVIRSSSFPTLADVTGLTGSSSEKFTSKKQMYVSPKIEVKIADMGNACWQQEKMEGMIQTKQYRALEVLLGNEYEYPADIWSVACIAFELATGEFLFNPKRTMAYTSSEDHILLIYELLGGIPPYIASRGRRSNRYFDAAGELKICMKHLLRIWSTEDVLVEKYDWKRVDAIPFAALINAMIEPDPELRLTAESGLQHQWLND